MISPTGVERSVNTTGVSAQTSCGVALKAACGLVPALMPAATVTVSRHPLAVVIIS
ncbi:MAG: hypothetical protein V9E88_18315 [Ferruginibacter sp.]